jgi:hypothetical protein
VDPTLWHIRSLETYASLCMLGKFCLCRVSFARASLLEERGVVVFFDEEEHSFLGDAVLILNSLVPHSKLFRGLRMIYSCGCTAIGDAW